MAAEEPTVRMLIVDDEPNMRKVLADVFADEGMSVDVTADGLTAVSLINQNSYDVAIVDLKLPRHIRDRRDQRDPQAQSIYNYLDDHSVFDRRYCHRSDEARSV